MEQNKKSFFRKTLMEAFKASNKNSKHSSLKEPIISYFVFDDPAQIPVKVSEFITIYNIFDGYKYMHDDIKTPYWYWFCLDAIDRKKINKPMRHVNLTARLNVKNENLFNSTWLYFEQYNIKYLYLGSPNDGTFTVTMDIEKWLKYILLFLYGYSSNPEYYEFAKEILCDLGYEINPLSISLIAQDFFTQFVRNLKFKNQDQVNKLMDDLKRVLNKKQKITITDILKILGCPNRFDSIFISEWIDKFGWDEDVSKNSLIEFIDFEFNIVFPLVERL